MPDMGSLLGSIMGSSEKKKPTSLMSAMAPDPSTAAQLPVAAPTDAKGQAQQKVDPALEPIRKLMANKKYAEAYMALRDLDPKKFAGNEQYTQIETFLKAQLGL